MPRLNSSLEVIKCWYSNYFSFTSWNSFFVSTKLLATGRYRKGVINCLILYVTNIQASELVGSLSSSVSNYFLLLKKRKKERKSVWTQGFKQTWWVSINLWPERGFSSYFSGLYEMTLIACNSFHAIHYDVTSQLNLDISCKRLRVNLKGMISFKVEQFSKNTIWVGFSPPSPHQWS